MRLLMKEHVDTLTSPGRIQGLHSALLDIHKRNIKGDIIECGVYKGGNIIIAKVFFDSVSDFRTFYCYDTFTGMVEPTEDDGEKANKKWERMRDENGWCLAVLDEVKNEFKKHNCLDDSIRFIEGDVTKTLLNESNLPKEIALLRLDTDWYDSTLKELEILYPRLVSGGYLIIDDYGHWEGARKAVNEFFTENYVKKNFIKLDNTGIMMKK